MRNHKGCNGVHILTEKVEGKPEYRHETKSEGELFSIYIFKDRKWVKIGEYCTTCGFHIFKEVLEKLFPIEGESKRTTEEGVPFIDRYEVPKRFSFIWQLPT